MLYELLSDKDKEMITRYINTYVLSDAEGSPASLDYILRIWDDAKSTYLYRMLGNSFFASKQVCVEKEKDEIVEQMERVCSGWNNPSAKFIDAMWGYINDHFPHSWGYRYNNEPIDKTSNEYIADCLRDLLNTETLVRNTYQGENCVIPGLTADDKPYHLNKGCKVSKALNSLGKLFHLNPDDYEAFRVAHSICLNEKKLSGTLILSIHPLDYMTMSDNNNNWGSCMSWTDHGEYRLGTVEMMNSPMVVEAYMASSSDYEPCFGVTWNNKRWRELFVVEPNAILGIKGYPFWNRGLEKEAIRFIQQLAQTNLGWGPYTSDIYLMRNDEPFEINDTAFGIEKRYHTISARTEYMYNDVYGEHNCVISVYANKEIHLNYSGMAECMCCGDTVHFDDCADTLLCYDCDGYMTCCECGERIWRGDAVEIDGNYYCEYCADRFGVTCSKCGSYHHEDNLIKVSLGVKDKGIILNVCAYLCEDCIDNDSRIKVKEIKGRWWRDTYHYIMSEELTDREFEDLFNIDRDNDLDWYMETAKNNGSLLSFENEETFN